MIPLPETPSGPHTQSSYRMRRNEKSPHFLVCGTISSPFQVKQDQSTRRRQRGARKSTYKLTLGVSDLGLTRWSGPGRTGTQVIEPRVMHRLLSLESRRLLSLESLRLLGLECYTGTESRVSQVIEPRAMHRLLSRCVCALRFLNRSTRCDQLFSG